MTKGYAYVALALADKNKTYAFYYGKTAVSPSVVPLKYDKFILWAPPQEIKFKRGDFTIKNRTRYYFNGKGNPFAVTLLKNKLKAIYGIKLKLGNSSSARIMLTLNPKNMAIKPEGYTLNVDRHGIKLEAKDEAGLYYGVRTLINVLRLSTPKGQPITARYLAINDWPGLPVRGILIILTSYVYALRGKTDINRMKEFLYRYIADNRYNTLIIDPVGMLKWDSHPEIYEALSPGDPNNNPPFTKAELKKLIAFARKHYITNIIPVLNTPGHSSWLLKSHPELTANPPIDATGKKLKQDVLNTRHPDTEKIVLALLGGYRPWSSGEHKVFTEYNHLMVAIAGANFWNKADAGETHFVKVSKKGSHIIRALQEVPEKNVTGLFSPIELSAIANRNLSADRGKTIFGLSTELDFSDFPATAQTIAGIPFKFTGKAYSPENKNSVKPIAINEKINSFYVMHTAYVNKASQDSFFPTIWTAVNDDRGYLAGYYRINYSDGSKVNLPLFFII